MVWKHEPISLIDVWDPKAVLKAMVDDGLASGSGSTFFLTSLLDHPDLSAEHLKLMSRIGLGGSMRCRSGGDRAHDQLRNLARAVLRLLTEHPSTTGSRHEETFRWRSAATPTVVHFSASRSGWWTTTVPTWTGASRVEILSRGPDLCVGYTDPAVTVTAFDAEGWFATGDVGVMDEDGYLAIVDRKKDIIIRGGENISALEVEEQLLRLPGVAEAAAVAAPDERLGEHVCGFLRLMPGADAPDLASAKAQFEKAGLARVVEVARGIASG